MNKSYAAALAGLLGAVPGASIAQQSISSQDHHDMVLQEIVVSATKRDQSIQEVPLAISALDAEALANQGIRTIQDIAQYVPGLSFVTSLPGRTTLVLRGISPVGGQPTVGLYLDDIPIGGDLALLQGMTEPQVLDVARVEVLKGPQGTLYGAGSLGGAVKLVSARPDVTEWSGFTLAGVSNVANGGTGYEGQAVLNMPLVRDRLALRVGGGYRYDSGYIDRIAGGTWADLFLRTDAATLTPVELPTGNTVNKRDVDDLKVTSGKLGLLFTPSESTEVLASLNYWRSESGDLGQHWLNLAPFQQSFLLDQPIEEEVTVGSLAITHRWDGVKLDSLTGYFRRENDLLADYTFFYRSLVGAGPLGPLFNDNPGDRHQSRRSQTWSQELRISSDDPQARLQWLAGVYGSRTDNDVVLRLSTYGIEAMAPPSVAPMVEGDVVYGSDASTDTEQYAAFGEATYSFTDRFAVTLGARWFRHEVASVSSAWGLLNGGAGPLEVLDSRETGINPKVSTSFRFDDDHMAYALAAKGFRPGGPNIIVPAVQCAADLARLGLTQAPASHKSDSLWNYEIGSKNTLLDRRITVNAAAYLIRWSEIQQQVMLTGCGIPFLGNVGAAESRGVELEVEARVTQRLTAGFGLAYADTEITETVPGVTAQVGDRVLGVPKLVANGFLQYEAPIFGSMAIRARVDHQYRDSQLTAFERDMSVTLQTGGTMLVPYAGRVQDASNLTNLSVALERDMLDLTVYVRNVFDRDDRLAANQLRSDQTATVRPRTIGVEARLRF